MSRSGKVFVTETVDSAGDVGRFASIDVDASGKVWIAYVEFRRRFDVEIRFASGGPGNWAIESAFSGSCQPSQVALDQNGAPGIVCSNGATMDYLHKVGEVWEWEAIGSGGSTLRWSWDATLAASSRGTTVAASIQDVEIYHEDLYFAIAVGDRNPNGWVVNELVRWYTPAPRPPYNIDIALDANDDPHMGTVPTANKPFQYFHHVDGVWSSEEVPRITADFAIAVDAQDKPIIVYTDEAGLWLAQKEATWNYFLIASDSAASSPDVVVDNNNVIHIMYDTPTEIRYAAKEADGTWQTWRVDGPGAGGGGIAVDADGVPHFAYQDLEMKDLRYATLTSSTPVRQKAWGAINSLRF